MGAGAAGVLTGAGRGAGGGVAVTALTGFEICGRAGAGAGRDGDGDGA